MQKELIREETDGAYLDALLQGRLDKRPYEVRIRTNFKTACWTFRKGRHYIFVGDALHKMLGRAVRRGDEEYVHSFFWHELGHSHFTERDLRALSNALKAEGISFQLHNLFEDARIEELMRRLTHRHFNWCRYEKIETSDTPGALLFAIIQQDGHTKGLEDSAVFERVYDYYSRAIAANDSWELIPIIKEWIAEFGEDSADNSKGASKEGDEEEGPMSLEDLQLALELQEDDDAFDAAMEDSVPADGSVDSDETPPEVVAETVTVEACTTRRLRLLGYDLPWDRDQTQRLTHEFAKLFEAKEVFQKSSRPTRKLNLRGIALGHYEEPFLEKTIEAPSVKRICIILDCSGSMRVVMDQMRVVIAVFNRLANAGMVEGNLVLSGVQAGGAYTETLQFPLPESIIGEIDGYLDAEGLDNAFRTALPLMQKADWNICLTDGQICDAPIDRRYFNNQGVRTFGIYIGREEYTNLGDWFDYQIVEPGPKQIVDKMLRLLR